MSARDEQAFLDAIVVNPDDDTPRLVFADWLDERAQGDDTARAALIRAQCRLEHVTPTSKEGRELTRRVKSLLKQHGPRWAKPLADLGFVRKWEFRRGFLDRVEMSATTFAEEAERVFAAAPTLRAARFPDAVNEVDRLADCEHLARLADVDLREMCSCGYCPIQNDLRALFNSTHTRSLTRLCIAGDRMGPTGARQLAASDALARLTALDVSDNVIGGAGVRAVAKSQRLKGLIALDLSRTAGVQEFEAGVLADLGKLPVLRRLALRHNWLSAASVAELLTTPLGERLVALDLRENPIGATGARVLAALPATAGLTHLDVRGCRLTEPAVRALRARFGKGLKV